MWLGKLICCDVMKDVEDLKRHKDHCDQQHLNHNRRHDDAAKNHEAQTKILERIADRLDGFEKTVTRTANNYTTVDTLLRWAGGGTVVIGLIAASIALAATIKGML